MAGWITIGKYHARVNLGKSWIHRKKVFPALGAGFVAYCVGLYLIFDTYKESIISLIGTPEGLEIVVFSSILSLIVLVIWLISILMMYYIILMQIVFLIKEIRSCYIIGIVQMRLKSLFIEEILCIMMNNGLDCIVIQDFAVQNQMYS